MEPQNYELKTLKDLLTIWEDINLITSLQASMHKINLRNLLLPPKPEYVPLDGSECNKFCNLAQPIPKFTDFRRSLEHSWHECSTAYLPKIPDIHKERAGHDQVAFVTDAMNQIFLMPFLIKEWSEYKKVCIIKNPVELQELAKKTKEPYLTHLPYSCFLLKLEESILFSRSSKGVISTLSFDTFFVRRQGDLIHVTGVPLGMSIIDEASRREAVSLIKEIEALIANARDEPPKKQSKLFKKMQLFEKKVGAVFKQGIPLLSLKETMMEQAEGIFSVVFNIKVDFKGLSQRSLLFKDRTEGSESSLSQFFNAFLQTLDGFCQSLLPEDASSEPSRDDESRAGGKKNLSRKPVVSIASCAWYEVPGHFINKVKLCKGKDGEVKYYVLQGAEKGPHVRREHLRTYKHKDGSFREQVIIREIKVKKGMAEEGAALRSGITR